MIRGFKEFGDTSRKALIIGYCEPQHCGQMVGSYYLVRDLIVSIGAIVGAFLWKLGPGLNFLGAGSSRRRWHDFLSKSDPPKPAIILERSKKTVGDAPKRSEIKSRLRST